MPSFIASETMKLEDETPEVARNVIDSVLAVWLHVEQSRLAVQEMQVVAMEVAMAILAKSDSAALGQRRPRRIEPLASPPDNGSHLRIRCTDTVFQWA